MKEITFPVSDEIVSYSIKETHLLGLTRNGAVLEYDDGKEKRYESDDIIYLSSPGNLFYIRAVGTIVGKLDENFNGSVMGKIDGAISGYFDYDVRVIVTDQGEL